VSWSPDPSDLPAGTAARRWAGRLAAWAVPREILRGAPRPPWFYPPELFRVTVRPLPDTPSTALARAALPAQGGTVLDVGCGGGRAGLALAPPAERVTGVDRDAVLLESFRAAATERGVDVRAVHGDWPAAAGDVDDADVVVCHHVVYNVSELGPFALALDARARRRIVIDLGREHPMVPLGPLWRQFWGLDRPSGPTADDALAVLREAGLPARQLTWREPPEASRVAAVPFDVRVEITRIRLCLTADRDAEVAAALRAAEPPGPREVVTIWWDRAEQ